MSFHVRVFFSFQYPLYILIICYYIFLLYKFSFFIQSIHPCRPDLISKLHEAEKRAVDIRESITHNIEIIIESDARMFNEIFQKYSLKHDNKFHFFFYAILFMPSMWIWRYVNNFSIKIRAQCWWYWVVRDRRAAKKAQG